MSKEFVLDGRDIQIAGGGINGSRTKARNSRAETESSANYTFTHAPTGIKVSGQIVPGNYSRKEITVLKQKLCYAIYKRLEIEVAKKLKMAGRGKSVSSSDSENELFEIIIGEFSGRQLTNKSNS